MPTPKRGGKVYTLENRKAGADIHLRQTAPSRNNGIQWEASRDLPTLQGTGETGGLKMNDARERPQTNENGASGIYIMEAKKNAIQGRLVAHRYCERG
jgi:hypothetical protein